jgi:hypothetical protein
MFNTARLNAGNCLKFRLAGVAMMGFKITRVQTIKSNIDRYQALLTTNLSDIETEYVTRKLTEEQFALSIMQSMDQSDPSSEEMLHDKIQ